VQLAPILVEMGCTLIELPNGLGVKGAERLRPISADLSDLPDSAQSLAVVCAFARGVSELRGLGTLRGKETDRLQALESELHKFGVRAKVSRDATLRIEGGARPPRGKPIATWGDHRMAMSFALAGLALAGVEIEEPEVVSKSFPEFWTYFDKLAAK
jgi:3-phosphoshikimate 1-carboxyvinyltransferase